MAESSDMSTADHRREAPASVAVHIVTVSDTRTLETDGSGRTIAELLGGAGHHWMNAASFDVGTGGYLHVVHGCASHN